MKPLLRIHRWLREIPVDCALMLVPTVDYFTESELRELADYVEIPVPRQAVTDDMRDMAIMYFNCYFNLERNVPNSKFEHYEKVSEYP